MKKKNLIKIGSYKVIISRFEGFVIQSELKNVNSYITAVSELLIWLETKGITNIKKVKQNDVQDYFNYLIHRPNERRGGMLSESHIKNNLHALRLFFDYLLNSNQNDKTFLLPKFVLKKHDIRYILSREEIGQLYEACETQQEKTILSICYGCGLRRSEATNLNIRDILFSKGILIVINGKGDKRREIPLSDNVIKSIKDYVHGQRNDFLKNINKIEDAFFVTQKGQRVSRNYLNKQLKKIIERTGNVELIGKDISLHNLRHSIATHLLENEAGFENVKDFLGHSEIDTTQLYLIRRKKRNVLTI